jgi:hypothetical protein
MGRVSFVVFTLVALSSLHATDYAIVTSDAAQADPDWCAVLDSMTARYAAEVFVYEDSLFEVGSELADLMPRYVCFVVKPSDIYSYPFGGARFIWHLHQLMRELDDDPYSDALFGVVTGYDAEDALRIATEPESVRVRTVLSGTSCAWLDRTYQGVSSAENVYGLRWFKTPDGSIVEDSSGPEDRTEWLVDLLNSDTFDLFITSGHANYSEWQLHYPDAGLEGFLRSQNGQLYGDAHAGDTFNVSSGNPKIYFGVGNCRIGRVNSTSCMVLAWLHTGGACQFTGYTVDTWYGYGTGGIPYFFHKLKDRFTWPEAYFLNYQCLVYDESHGTPGTDSSGLAYDKNVVALYGDPALDIRLVPEPNTEPLYDQNLEIVPGSGDRDTFRFTLTVNDSCRPGFTGAWGDRHPMAFLPERIGAASVDILSHDGYDAVVTDNFVLFRVWEQDDPMLAPGETRELVFTAKPASSVTEDLPLSRFARSIRVRPDRNPSQGTLTFLVESQGIPDGAPLEIRLYDLSGRRIRTLLGKISGTVTRILWDGVDSEGSIVGPGVYFYHLNAPGSPAPGRILRL